MQFEDWFYEIEGFGLRAERFYESLDGFKEDMLDSELIVQWLKAAYEEGYNQAKYDVMKLYWDDGK